jgi:hypothetical protein
MVKEMRPASFVSPNRISLRYFLFRPVIKRSAKRYESGLNRNSLFGILLLRPRTRSAIAGRANRS